MGTSKGYIPPTKPEWSSAKRAVSSFLRNRDEESKENAIHKFGEAMSSAGIVSGSTFSSAAGNILGFAQGIRENGLDNTLVEFGREDLIGKKPDEILEELIYQFTNNSSTLEDSLASDALSQALENLNIETVDDLGKVEIDALLREMVADFVIISFDLVFDEKIGKGRGQAEKEMILKEMHTFIADAVYSFLSQEELKKVDFANMSASSVVKNSLDEAYRICASYYGGNNQ
ncbi:hypothetical protein [Pseudobutyrivibrio sp.]|jgi:hypothetical protein|uniref:hypothetical protein n=1 Tax=Pseudobutyrivibrio sp. TaxID=2014367 RepID=UPI0025FB7987|nr:hypothetical protein [Pseudobutyrivibrio sp.]